MYKYLFLKINYYLFRDHKFPEFVIFLKATGDVVSIFIKIVLATRAIFAIPHDFEVFDSRTVGKFTLY